MNKISAAGRVVADAETRFTPDGTAVCSFRLASDVGYGDKKTTNWFTCQLWGKRGESLAPHLAKGSQVTVWGTLTLREWNNKEGIKQLSPEIRIDEIALQGQRQQSTQQQPKPQASNPADMDDSIPF